MKDNQVLYKVWFDTELNDFISIESNNVTLNLLINLNKVGIKTKDVLASSRYEALEKTFPQLERFEKPMLDKPYYKKPKLSLIK